MLRTARRQTPQNTKKFESNHRPFQLRKDENNSSLLKSETEILNGIYQHTWRD